MKVSTTKSEYYSLAFFIVRMGPWIKERTLHQQMNGVFIDSRSSTGRHFSLSSGQFFLWCKQLEPTAGVLCSQLDGDPITNYSKIGDGHLVGNYKFNRKKNILQ